MATKLVPYMFIIGAFTFIYRFVPNTKVRFRSALVGALVGGVLWQTTGMLFASFAAGSTRYDAIYTSFAILIMFMIWLYLNWLILLLGAQIAYFHQHPEQIRLGSHELKLSNRLKERLSLLIMTLITDSYCNDKPAWTMDGLAHHLKLPGSSVAEIIEIMTRNELLVETAQEPPQYIPRHDPETIGVATVLKAARRAAEENFVFNENMLHLPAVDGVLDTLEQGALQSIGETSLKELVSKPARQEPAGS
jgi:membrane protein